MSDQTQFAWLIEAPGPCYLSAHPMGNDYYFRWTDDATKALRFYNEVQADLVMMAIRSLKRDLFVSAYTREPRPVQHGFVESP